MAADRLPDADYRRLLEFRDGLRRFLKWSADRAREAGITPSQHQLLLAVRGHAHADGPTVADVAGHLLLRHHSAGELIDRCVRGGLVVRLQDPVDSRAVRIRLTPEGERRLDALSGLHLAELRHLGPRRAPIWAGLDEEA